jgi:hypothetical protein
MADHVRLTLMISMIAGCGVLAACSRASVTAAHTVDWYLSHAADRASMVERCANDPGTLGKTPDCVNAFAAAQRADFGSLRRLPPMGLMDGGGNPHAAPGHQIPERP